MICLARMLTLSNVLITPQAFSPTKLHDIARVTAANLHALIEGTPFVGGPYSLSQVVLPAASDLRT